MKDNYKFSVVTLGCKVNQYESDAITTLLQAKGWEPVDPKDKADCYVINTCTVTQKASMQSRQVVRQAIRNNPYARVIVTGCYAQTEPDHIKRIHGVSAIVGHGQKHNIPNMLSEGKPFPMAPCKIAGERTFRKFPTAAYGTRTRPFLKIQDGCSAFCSYCIVPYSRGPGRSMQLEEVIKNLEHLKFAGFKEAVLTGIHLGAYGLDFDPKTDLYNLLKLIAHSSPIHRIRVSSIEPDHLNHQIIRLVAESEVFCHHFHVPLQSGHNLILKKMRRPYKRDVFKKHIQKIHELIPDAAIGTDIIVGFPGETEQAFETTYSLIKSLPITYLHVFPFSGRKKTPAYSYKEKTDPNVIKKRAWKMRTLGSVKKQEFFRKFIGKRFEVIIEGKRDKKTGFLKGVTSNYIPVLATGDDSLKNRLVNITITDVKDADSVSGAILS